MCTILIQYKPYICILNLPLIHTAFALYVLCTYTCTRTHLSPTGLCHRQNVEKVKDNNDKANAKDKEGPKLVHDAERALENAKVRHPYSNAFTLVEKRPLSYQCAPLTRFRPPPPACRRMSLPGRQSCGGVRSMRRSACRFVMIAREKYGLQRKRRQTRMQQR